MILRDGAHTRPIVYSEMLRSIMLWYTGLGDFRQLTEGEIAFFYDGIRPSLKEATKPKGP